MGLRAHGCRKRGTSPVAHKAPACPERRTDCRARIFEVGPQSVAVNTNGHRRRGPVAVRPWSQQSTRWRQRDCSS
eukprot:7326620-Prymnesium_polylepis.1